MSEDKITPWSIGTVGVTGAGGFIGSHLVETLLKEGASVRAFLRYNSRGDRGFLDYLDDRLQNGLEIVAGDLRDGETVRRFMTGCRVVFHLGALIGIPYSYISPRDVVDTNVLGTLNVLQAAREQGVERLVHTSTSEVYGTARYTPIDEAHPLQGQSPYAASKIGADKLVESYHLSFQVPAVTVRPFNTYGPRQSLRAVIPTIIVQALQGSEIRLGSLEPRRDFNYVSDTVRGFLLAGQTSNIEGQTINLGSGATYRIGEVVELVLAVLGLDLPVISDGQRVRPAASEVQWLEADANKARVLLGWSSQVSLREGISRSIGWLQDAAVGDKALRYGV